MTPDRWHRVKELFESAWERAPEDRPAFLAHACDGDESMRKEVESLLASFDEGESFMEQPAVALAAETLAGSQGESMVGQTIGHYQVTREIGSGGMGEVYLAQDAKLGRQVALKLLPSFMGKDEDRLHRFEREARTASALNHPNVCIIYEVGDTPEGRHYIAMEYIDGATLRQHITETRLKLSEVLDVAAQAASGLAAAHEAGIVHRDIKPENIMMRSDGYIKVLDFGLAKLTEQEAPDVAAPGGVRVTTDTGVVMGTSRYMSPEQARGLSIDARTDIWSLGVVIYEMTTGRPPFEGATTSDVIVSILEREPPPLEQFSPAMPAELQRIITKALSKDKEERYQLVSDLLRDLKSLRQDSEFEAKLERSVRSDLNSGATAEGTEHQTAVSTSSGSVVRTGRDQTVDTTSSAEYLISEIKRHRKSVLLALLALVIAISAVAWIRFSNRSYESLMPPVPPMKTVPFTSFPGRELQPAFSPDGKQLAFAWNGASADNFDIYVKLIGAGTPLRLTTNPGIDFSPAWSADGRYIAFVRYSERESGIFIVPALGGTERKLYSPNWQDFIAARVTWSPDGKFLAFPDRSSSHEPYSLFLLSVETLEKRRLTSPPSQHHADSAPSFSPDGQTLSFTRMSADGVGDLYLVPLVGGEPRRLTFDNTLVTSSTWAADGGSLVFSSRRGGSFQTLWRILASGGTPEALGGIGEKTGCPTISRQGNSLAYCSDFLDINIWQIEVSSSTGQGSSPAKLIASTRQEGGPQLSPDGERIVFESDRSGTNEIWVCDREGSNPLQLTFSDGPLVSRSTPRWSPDGRYIAFDSRIEGSPDIYVIDAEGGRPRRMTIETSDDVAPSWSRDGRWIYFGSKRSGDWQVWKIPSEGGEAIQVTKHGGFAALESADGAVVYYAKIDAPGLWRIEVKGSEEKLILDQLQPGLWGYWAVVDRGIYFVNTQAKPGPAIEFFSFATRRLTQVALMEKDPFQGIPGLTVSADGKWILYAQLDEAGSDIMLLENFR